MARQRDIEVARQDGRRLPASDRRPNWTWEVSYGQRTGYSDMVSFGVSIPLPVAPRSGRTARPPAKLALVDKAEAELEEASARGHRRVRAR